MREEQAPPPGQEAQTAEQSLSDRPVFSIRFRIIVAFLLAFLFSLGITVTSVIFVLRLDDRQVFLEKARLFSQEIQEARRYEKNYFLYGARSELFDAQNNIHAASNILNEELRELKSNLSPATLRALSRNLERYETLLKRLSKDAPRKGDATAPRDPDLEEQLRRTGHGLLLTAAKLEKREREQLRKTAHTFTLVAIFSLLLNFVVMAWLATELTRQILRPLSRAVGYTQRIAAGDFTLITPQRKYRDEFSNLAIAINRMILELADKQDQLVQSRKMAAIGTLTSGIAHELNNPLNNISITAESLLEGAEEHTPEQMKKMLNDIFIEVTRASGTVRTLLDFTRVQKTPPEAIGVKALVEGSLALVRNELNLSRVEARADIPSDLPDIRGNLRNLQQVLLNLFLNAIQAMDRGGQLQVSARTGEDHTVLLSVSDDGCGIAQKNLSKIFDPFFTTKEEGQGTGLGLSVSYSIIQKMGGTISVESEPGKGTTFQLRLPVADPDDNTLHHPSDPAIEGRPSGDIETRS